MKAKISLIFLLLIIKFNFDNNSLQADLDGTITPIILDTKYTFSNGESVNGIVFLNGGFDLPPNGTVFFNLLPGPTLEGIISGTSSTIIFNRNASFGPTSKLVGSFFLHGTNQTLINDSDQTTISISGIKTLPKTILTGRIVLQGINSCELRSGTLDLGNPNLVKCTLRNMTILSPNLRTSSALNVLELNNVNMIAGIGNTIILRPPTVNIVGNCSFTAFNRTFFVDGTIRCEQSGTLTITPLTKIKVGGLGLANTPTRLILSNCDIDVSNGSVGSDLFFGASLNYTTAGIIIIQGNSTIRSSNKNVINLGRFEDIIFENGSKLTLAEETYLKIN